MRLPAAILLLAVLALGPGWRGQDAPLKAPEGAGASSPALDWDRDFDLILESRQAGERENARKNAKVEGIQRELDTLRKEEADLKARAEIFAGNVTGEEAMAEMVRLEAGTPDRARAVLEGKLAEVQRQIQDLEGDLKRAKRARK